MLSTLQDHLRSGDVFVAHSRRCASLDTYLIDKKSWVAGLQQEAVRQLGLSETEPDRLSERLAELESYLALMQAILQEGGDIRLDEKGELIITPLEAEDVPASAKTNESLSQVMPEVELTDLLVEVDQWTGFSACFHGLEHQAKFAEHTSLLYAALLANACNIPLSDIARSTGLDYKALWRVSTYYLREETLKQVNVQLVNYHHRQ